ncbi:MAG: histidine phosphatase family protein [Candidatus Binataceae bacterium]
MGKLILVRHGESEGNRIRHFTNSPDAAITELGRRQAYEAALRIKSLFKPTLIFASPYYRARETARIIAEQVGAPIEIEQDFREQSLGQLAGKPYDLVRDDPNFKPDRSWEWRPAGGESQEDVRIRIAPVFDRMAREHGDRELVIVSHGGVMRALWAHVTDRWEGAHIPVNCGIVLVEHDGSRYLLPRIIDGEEDGAHESGGWIRRLALSPTISWRDLRLVAQSMVAREASPASIEAVDKRPMQQCGQRAECGWVNFLDVDT